MKAIYEIIPVEFGQSPNPIMQEEMSFEAIVDDRQQATDTTTAHFE